MGEECEPYLACFGVRNPILRFVKVFLIVSWTLNYQRLFWYEESAPRICEIIFDTPYIYAGGMVLLAVDLAATFVPLSMFIPCPRLAKYN